MGDVMRISSWFHILRAPNLLTVPGDPLAGAVLAFSLSGVVEQFPAVDVFCVVLAALAFYAVGVMLNDLVDIGVDRIERPERPLVIGAISVRSVLCASVLLALTGLGLAAVAGWKSLIAGGCLLGLVLGYNLLVKRRYWAGSIAMGLCRGGSVLLGASVTGVSVPVAVVAAGVAGYVATVTAFAKQENVAGPARHALLLPLWPCLTFVCVLFVAPEQLSGAGVLFAGVPWVLTIGGAGCSAKRLSKSSIQPADKRTSIGRLLRLLVLWQATYIIITGIWWAWFPGVVLLALYPVHAMLSRKCAVT